MAALEKAESAVAYQINSVYGRAGLGKDAFRSNWEPTIQQTPIEVSDENRLNAARVQQTGDFALLDHGTATQDQYTLELEKLQQAKPEQAVTLDTSAAQAAVDAAYINNGLSELEGYANTPKGQQQATVEIEASTQPLSPIELEAQAAVEAAFADYVDTGLNDLDTFTHIATEQV